MNKADVIVNLTLVSDHDTTLVLKPGMQALDLPTATIASQGATILRTGFATIDAMRRNHLDATACQQRIQPIAVVGFVTNQTSRFIRHKTGCKCGFNKLGFMRRSTRYVNGDRKAMAVCNDHNFATFAAFGLADALAPFLAGTNVASMKHSDKSNWPRVFKSSARTLSICTNAPAFTQVWKYRWHVVPGGYRLGISCQAAPVRMIQKIPFITSRGLRRGRPLPSARRGRSGIKGWINLHCASVKSIVQSPRHQVTVLPFLR